MKFNGRIKTRDHASMDARRKDATERNAAWQALSPTEQLRVLDGRLGKGVGAVKQRAKLMLILAPKAAEALMSDPPNGGNPGGGFTDTPYPAKKSKRKK